MATVDVVYSRTNGEPWKLQAICTSAYASTMLANTIKNDPAWAAWAVPEFGAIETWRQTITVDSLDLIPRTLTDVSELRAVNKPGKPTRR